MKPSYFKAALAADALSLGPHWVYDQDQLAREFPDGITGFSDPVSEYHKNRRAGQLTHLGDQMVMLQKALQSGKYDQTTWRQTWLEEMKTFDGYLDGASKDTLATQGLSPSPSTHDLAGASRIAPILDLDLSLDEKVEAARSQTALTHGPDEVREAAEFYVRATGAVADGLDFKAAFRWAIADGSYSALKPLDHLEAALAAGPHFRKVGKNFGVACNLSGAFPLSLYFALRPGADFSSAISENGLIGGDTSARSMLFALLFEARDPGSASSHAPEPTTSSPKPKTPGMLPA
jgi:ADP-ribosylglycohydrolase